MSLIKEYFELTKKYQKEYGERTVVLMQVGSFIEVYGIRDTNTNAIIESQICEFARLCELNIATKNVCVGNNNVVMAGFIVSILEKYLKKLQDAGYTCVLYLQDEQAKNTTRSLAGIFSPGTYFPMETSQNLTNNITCIWVQMIENKLFSKGKFVEVGISNIDIYNGKSSMFQFKETYINNPTTYDELERFISIYNPSEVIIISNLPYNEVNDIINYTNIQCNSIHKISLSEKDDREKTQKALNCEKQIYQKEILTRFYNFDDYSIFIQNFYENVYATQSFCFLLDFVYQHNPYLVKKIAEPIFDNFSDRLILANHSLKQLNIIDDNNYNGKYSSVVKMLNMCITPMGKRKFTYQFLNPTTNKNLLQNEYDITEHFLNNYESNASFLKTNFSELKDLSKLNRQVFIKKITPKTLYYLYKNLEITLNIVSFFKSDDKLNNYLKRNLKNVDNIHVYCKKLIQFIDDSFIIDMCVNIDQIQNFDVNFFKKGINSELDNISEIIMESNDKLEAIRLYFNEIIMNSEKKSSSTSNDYVKIHETEKNKHSIIATVRRCTILQNALPKDKNSMVKLKYKSSYSNVEKEFDFECSSQLIEFETQTASNKSIVNKQIEELCKTINTNIIHMKDIIYKIYFSLIEKFESMQDEIETIIGYITLLDIIYAKATISKKYNYCKPQIDDSAEKSFVNACGLRHCLIEHIQQNEIYVTNDIELGKGQMDGMLLYGTNAVGKTSFIRALGISLIMAQSGLYVPASSFVYNPYKYIFTRILGNDNIFKGLSTFAVEMSELRTILRLSNKDSLILGDELCSGTESISAVSIFVAGIQKLYEKKSSFIFATHLHEIVNYDEIKELTNVCLKHMAVVYDREKDILVYDRKLRDGPGDNMYGLEVCKSLSLPTDFLEAAHNIRMKYHPEANSILTNKQSHFNSNKIMSMCEKCGENIGTEVHHLEHQTNASTTTGIITKKDGTTFHKNHLANLLTVCEKCHKEFHSSEKNNATFKKTKTTKGYKITQTS